MFPIGPIILITAVLLFSAAASVFGLISGGALAFAWVMSFAALFGLLLLLDGHGAVRRTGAGLLAAVALGVALTLGIHPALAQTAAIAPPAGDTGLWSALNGWVAPALGTALTALLGWAVALFTKRTGIQITAAREASLRETMRTGLFQAVHELEIAIDDRWTPAQRQKIVDRVVAWAQARAATELKKLGLPSFVVNAMASKVIGEVQLGLTGGTIDGATLTSAFAGNPGETPALDRAAGGNGGN